jgi:hypothetical protein
MLVSDIEVDLPALESVLDDVSSPRTENPSTPPSATGR